MCREGPGGSKAHTFPQTYGVHLNHGVREDTCPDGGEARKRICSPELCLKANKVMLSSGQEEFSLNVLENPTIPVTC